MGKNMSKIIHFPFRTYMQQQITQSNNNASSSNNYTHTDDFAIAAGASQNDSIYIGIHDFQNTTPEDVPFSKGDRLEILIDAEERKHSKWWYAKNLETNVVGLAPYNYLKKFTDEPCTIPGWVDSNRVDANRRLLRAGLKPGTYLIRPCTKNAKFALSVRIPDPRVENNFLVKHFLIKNSADGKLFFINRAKAFPSVTQLINEYKKGGLGAPLTEPCPDEPPVVQFKEIEVSRETIKFIDKLGAGSFGDVWKAKWNCILDVAVKTLKQGTAMSSQSFLEEAKTMHKLSHPKIVNILGVCTQIRDPSDKIFIITEYMENGSLLDYLRKKQPSERLPMSVLLDIAYQIAAGMAYLEKMKFVHRDLRAANVLVGKDNFVKVADFGLARIVQEDDTYQAETIGKFPVKWTAPEAMHENKFTTKSDVWSFGVLLYEILTHGGSVYVGMSNKEVMEFVRDPKNRLPIPKSSNMSPKDFETARQIHQRYMMSCWDHNPDARPTFHTLKQEFEDTDAALESQYIAET